MTDQASAGLFNLLLTSISVLTPLVGAIVAAVSVRRRGRNARLALIGCLVMAPGPIVLTLGMVLGLDSLMRAFGPLMAQPVLSAIAAPFHLIGFGLVLAGALAEAPSANRRAGRAAGQQGRDVVATV